VWDCTASWERGRGVRDGWIVCLWEREALERKWEGRGRERAAYEVLFCELIEVLD